MTDQSWETRLEDVYELMHEMSRQTEPQAMVQAYGARVGKMFPSDRRLSLSRRDLEAPYYRITRYTGWDESINPWTQKDRLPLLKGGLLADLIYSNRPHLFDDLELPADDPAAEYLENQRSLMAIPMLDNGESLNMVVATREQPHGFDRERFPDTFWLANLFGRATHNLVLKEQVREALEQIDHELKVVSQIQQALLPKSTPDIPNLKLSAYYRTSQRAGGDYYDFFPLAENQWGILIADVSGHGTPAAVIMAITHSIAHLFPGQTGDPGEMLAFVNEQLCRRYTTDIEAFVTAFYAIYDVNTQTLTCSSAGHHIPRLWKCAQQRIVDSNNAGSFPLGVFEQASYSTEVLQLDPGDRLILYTDGITEAMNRNDEQFGPDRLDEVLNRSCRIESPQLLDQIVQAVAQFTDHQPPVDDQTIIVGTVR